MAEKRPRSPGAEKKAQQRAAQRAAETEARVAAVKARAGRATTDAEGALQQGLAEASARVQARKEAPKKERTFGPVETRAREISTRLLGGVPRTGSSIKRQLRPEDVHGDLPGKVFTVKSGSQETRPMTGDEIGGITTLMAMRDEIGRMMRRRFEPARGADRSFVETVDESTQVDKSKIDRHKNLARERSMPMPLPSVKRVRKFSKVTTSQVDPRELPTEKPATPQVMDMAAIVNAGRQRALLQQRVQSVVPNIRSGKAPVKATVIEKRRTKREEALEKAGTPQSIYAGKVSALTEQYGPETVPWQKTMSAISPAPRQRSGPIDATPSDWGVGGAMIQPAVQEDDSAFVTRFEASKKLGVRQNVKDSTRYERIMFNRAWDKRQRGETD